MIDINSHNEYNKTPRPRLIVVNDITNDIISYNTIRNIENDSIILNSNESDNIDILNSSKCLISRLIRTPDEQLETNIKFQRYIISALIFQLVCIGSISYLCKSFGFGKIIIISNLLEINCIIYIIIFGCIIFNQILLISHKNKYKYCIFIFQTLLLSFISYILTIKYDTNIIITFCIITIIIFICNILYTRDILINCSDICFILCVSAFLFMFTGFLVKLPEHIRKIV